MSTLTSTAVPVEMTATETGFLRRNGPDGARVAYQTWGRRRPGASCGDVLLVHGSLQSSKVWSKHGYVAQLAQRYRVITIDVRGHGRSDKPEHPAGYDIQASVRDVCALLDHLEIAQTHFLGYSLGGRIGLTMAAAAPERLASLVVAGSSSRPQCGAVNVVMFPDAIAVTEKWGVEGFVQGWQEHRGTTMGSGFRATVDALGARGLVALMRQWDAEPGVAEDVLAQVQTPSLFFAGSRDMLRLADSRHAAALMPRAYFTLLEGADHGQTIAMRDRILDRAEAFFRLAEFPDIEKLSAVG
ncbi:MULTISPECIES: alpha/beta fold hydrolase [Mycobacteriaceae]|uniref:Alpha/beta hydrolase n=1 Tax=Mycolicibacterium mucogenicum TaxID=56689 RepID=A0A4R5W968_MYCMU|nr:MULTISPECIES: alpha/beta hydrolase [Mycolicibacterium]MCX8556379.1 alpha/beta hydrolase [Mycolicibacterium mucogenicum]TDK85559.1 alpha/beta hydrolase [Mycolicibacterium mucogenicum]